MKIISKHKEYYDYVQGIYGIDELLTYDRRVEYLEKPREFDEEKPRTYYFAICGRKYLVIHYLDNFYHTIDELMVLHKLLKKNGISYDRNDGLVDNYHYDHRTYRRKKSNIETEVKRFYDEGNVETDYNKIHRHPVLVSNYHGTSNYGVYDHDWSIPYLTKFGFGSWIPAEEIYRDISYFIGWLNDNPEIPNNQTNKEKILSHGFDMKKSFRHRK